VGKVTAFPSISVKVGANTERCLSRRFLCFYITLYSASFLTGTAQKEGIENFDVSAPRVSVHNSLRPELLQQICFIEPSAF
jgi:hypothetical protein